MHILLDSCLHELLEPVFVDARVVSVPAFTRNPRRHRSTPVKPPIPKGCLVSQVIADSSGIDQFDVSCKNRSVEQQSIRQRLAEEPCTVANILCWAAKSVVEGV